MARLKTKLAAVLLILCGTLVIFMIRWNPATVRHFGYVNREEKQNANLQSYEEIDCSINGLYKVHCRRENSDVFVPFSFLEKYFEVYGKLATWKGQPLFEWSHSYSKIYKPTKNYDSSGAFMYFSNYNVEVRDRVKCISAVEGVPVSTQWQDSGYYYPVQIAQYGLSHFSKNLTETSPNVRILEDGYSVTAKWQVPRGAFVRRTYNTTHKSHLVEFNSRDSAGISLRLKPGTELVMSLNVFFQGINGSLTIYLENREKNREIFPITFLCSSTLIEIVDKSIVYGLGSCQKWITFTRDLFIDLLKGHILLGRGKKLSRSKFRLVNMTLKGYGILDNLTLSTSDHSGMFYSSADWLVRHQDHKGGWPIQVRRKMASGLIDLAPGWYSAMGQGQAMSLLMRAFNRSGRNEYLEAAVNGMKPFSKLSKEGGVRAYFMNEYPWYEEYPTTPASFVLNGFIYSLIGLFDVFSLSPSSESQSLSKSLLDQGMRSLKKMLPLFDTGSGSVYDLRHFSLGIAPNIARWDYHSTHINQLLLLATIDPDPILSSVAERWIGYMQGKRAAHN